MGRPANVTVVVFPSFGGVPVRGLVQRAPRILARLSAWVALALALLAATSSTDASPTELVVRS
jgi:hypothetical protein